MKEYKADAEGQQRVHVYWLAYKTQLIRRAPHHVRTDIKSIGHALDDAQQALSTVQQLRYVGSLATTICTVSTRGPWLRSNRMNNMKTLMVMLWKTLTMTWHPLDRDHDCYFLMHPQQHNTGSSR